jgi:hypothetical protein
VPCSTSWMTNRNGRSTARKGDALIAQQLQQPLVRDVLGHPPARRGSWPVGPVSPGQPHARSKSPRGAPGRNRTFACRLGGWDSNRADLHKRTLAPRFARHSHKPNPRGRDRDSACGAATTPIRPNRQCPTWRQRLCLHVYYCGCSRSTASAGCRLRSEGPSSARRLLGQGSGS